MMAKIANLSATSAQTMKRCQRFMRRYSFPLKNHNIIAYFAIWLWGTFEIVLCMYVLFKGSHEYVDNFMYNLCPQSDLTCGHFIKKALTARICMSALLLVGNITGFNFLMLPWFLLNAFGVFPLIPIVVSRFWTYEEIYKYLSPKTTALNFLVKIVKTVLFISSE